MAAEYIAGLCTNLTYTLRPERIIIGGGVSSDPEQFFRYLENVDAKIVPATMGNDAGIVGAAERDLAHKLASMPGGLRGLSQSLRQATIVAAGAGKAVDARLLLAAWNKLGGQS